MKYSLNGEESQRLNFHYLKDEYFDAWLPLLETNEASRFLGMADIPTAKGRCEKWFELTKHRYENELGGMHVLTDKQNGNLIGQCGLLVQEVDGQKELEIGYSILPKFWGMGYASEAAKRCKDFAFSNAFSKSIISIVHIDNIRSEKVALKNGMSLDKKTNFKGMPVKVFRIYFEHWK